MKDYLSPSPDISTEIFKTSPYLIDIKHLRKDFGRISERIRIEFGSTTSRVFELIYIKTEITAEEIALEIGKTSRTVETHLAKLKNGGYIERKSPKLGGYWEVL